jgi:aryl-alcohol dehydrogenase-like predicted oxidoreductase
VLDELFAVAEETGRPAAQVAVKWLLSQPDVTAPIVGARTMEQLTSHLAVVDWELEPEQVRRLSDAAAQRLPYPYGLHAGLPD